ncbi:hypothetical protein CDL15_Pgr025065 [Punica granatum]|uniref:Uncharacterized protein n=1 Tax=Punica granatum TaxID=22663 RepID=A0A218W8R8_PUNGR|nr:hypothetical protein CDL15_Pgr025065 [Punica granatum]
MKNTRYPELITPTIKVHVSNTTRFHAHFDSCANEDTAHRDRVLKRVIACDPYQPLGSPYEVL